MSAPKADILVLGATGFTGRLIARYISTHRDYTSTPRKFTFALGGRSRDRLEKIAAELNLGGEDAVPRVVVDTSNKQQVDEAVRTARVVINVVGPFWRYSKLVVKSCAENGVHYVDLTGEPHFMQYVIDECDAPARASGATLIPASGQDCIPSDLSVFISHQTLQERYPTRGLADSTSAFQAKGAVSGGTIETSFSLFEEISSELRRQTTKPWALSPIKGSRQPRPQLTYEMPHSPEPMVGGVFMMAPVDKLVVQRTWGLLQCAAIAADGEDAKAKTRTYGDEFVYDEFMVTPSKLIGALVTLALTFGLALIAFPPTRWILKKLVPQPGSGPSELVMQNGHIRVTNISRSTADPSTGKRAVVRTVIDGRGDPGYLLTSVEISESALALALDHDSLPALGRKGGALTPASALGEVLARRLEQSGRWKVESSIIDESA